MRIVVLYMVLVTAALGIAIVVTRQVLLARVDRSVAAQLAQETEELRVLVAEIDPATGEPFGNDVTALLTAFLSRSIPADDEAFFSFVDGEPFLYSFNAPPELLDDPALVERWAAVPESTTGTASTVAGPISYLAVPLFDGGTVAGVFVVTAFPAEARGEVTQAIRIIAVTGAAVLVVTAIAAWSVAGQVLRPVRELTETARSIHDADLSGRIPVDGDDELAELGRTFNDMVDRLEEGFASQRRFLDDVAHELRTPITIVQGHLDVLGDDPVERADTVEVITEELDRMNRYVSDLLLLAKAEQPDFLHPGPVDVGDLIDSVLGRVGGLGDRRWTDDGAPRPGTVVIDGDDQRLTQALLNLVGNAVEHTGPGDEIAIGASFDATHARLWVRDTGPGIDPAVADQLFERNARGATSRASRPGGTGLGLSIVDAIAKAHGGSVSVDGRPGVGAIFTLTIPREPT
jgi:two-component system, OmpR family, sensor kinase